MRNAMPDVPPGKLINSMQITPVRLAMLIGLAFTMLAGCAAVTSPASPTGAAPSPTAAPLQVTTNSLPADTQGTAYSAMLAASGGTPPYAWSMTSGALPVGLQLSTAGMIGGAATAAGNFSFKAQVKDAKATVASAALSLNVTAAATSPSVPTNPAAPTPTISGISPVSGPAAGGTAVTISGSNFLTGARVSFGSSAVSGVQVTNAGQIVAVTPAEATGAVGVTVQNTNNQTATLANAFTFNPAALQIATTSVPGGSVGANYSIALAATGGTPPYAWSVSNGALPGGLQLNLTAGTIAGTPTTAGTFAFTAGVKDAKAVTSSANLSVKIASAGTGAGPIVSITAPTSGTTVSGSVSVTATASDAQSNVTSVQFLVNNASLGAAVTAAPYAKAWDTSQLGSGNYNLSAKVTDAAGNTATSAAVVVTVGANTGNWSPSVLGVPWASDFNSIAANQINVKTDTRLSVKAAGDGSTDDTGAVRGAIQLATKLGGAMVYFPTGDYKLVVPSNATNASPLTIPSRVILRGATSATSRLFLNDNNAGSETDYFGTWGGIQMVGASLSGITDLGIIAVNTSTSQCSVLSNRGSTGVSEIFFNNLDIHLTNCRNVWINSSDRVLMQNSKVDSTSTVQGPIYIVANTNVSFLNNTITYLFGRVHMQNNTGLLMQGNTLKRDGQGKAMQNGNAIESGGVELSFGQNLQILDNTIQTLNAVPDQRNDGEAITTQNSTTQDVLDAGSATGVGASTLTDTNALWGSSTASRIPQYPHVIVILSGSATGEVRSIQGIDPNTKTLTVTQPWGPTPEVGSLYSIFVWTVMNATFQGNTLIDNPNGIAIWDGCNNCTVQNNVLTNSRGIMLRTVDQELDKSIYPEGRRIHLVAMNSNILNNTVSNTSGLRPAFIALDVEAFAQDHYQGMGIMNVEVGGNKLNPLPTSPSQQYGQNEISQDGYYPCFLFGPAPNQAPVTTAFQNIHYWNNSTSLGVSYEQGFAKFTTQACVTPSAP